VGRGQKQSSTRKEKKKETEKTPKHKRIVYFQTFFMFMRVKMFEGVFMFCSVLSIMLIVGYYHDA
jgi:hypothetical protein